MRILAVLLLVFGLGAWFLWREVRRAPFQDENGRPLRWCDPYRKRRSK